MKFLYTLAFLFGADHWKMEGIPMEILDSLKEFKKAQAQILDLGCGTGEECISLASMGQNVTGIDFIPLAIRQAEKSAKRAKVEDLAHFMLEDVSKLSAVNLPPIHFAYDLGCFYLLRKIQMKGYISGLGKVMVNGGLFLLNAFTPRKQGRKIVGFDVETVKDLFGDTFDLEMVSEHSYWRFPAIWYWLRKL